MVVEVVGRSCRSEWDMRWAVQSSDGGVVVVVVVVVLVVKERLAAGPNGRESYRNKAWILTLLQLCGLAPCLLCLAAPCGWWT